MVARSRVGTRSHSTHAFVLRRTPYGEADLIVSLFSQKLGQVSALARAARKSQRRFGGSLEPFHTLEVELEEASGAELMRLREARILGPRPGLLTQLGGMEAAGTFLGWIRHSAPAHTPEPALWGLLVSCLDELEAAAISLGGLEQTPAAVEVLLSKEGAPGAPPPPPRAPLAAPGATSMARLTLAAHGLWLLGACGWRLELEYCVESGVRCPEGKAALIDPARGGLVSRARGGAGLRVSGALRQRLIATQSGPASVLQASDVDLTLQLVEGCLRAHAGLAS